MKLKPVEQQVVVVFGATSGIGRETAVRFARHGAKVVAAARGEDGLASLAKEILDNGGEVTTVAADTASFEQVHAVADLAVTAYGRIDTWVHVAAVTVFARFEDTTPEEYKQVIDVNLLGQIHGALAALPHLRREGRGALIHVSSVEAVVSLPFQAAYAASKHGVKGFLDALRMELKRERVPIAVTDIQPSTINTPLYDKARSKIGTRPKGVPPIYEPRVVAGAILYAAEHPTHTIVAGGAGKALTVAHRIAPRLTETILGPIAWRLEHTEHLKDPDAPDNLNAPLPGYDTASGPYTARSHKRSAYTWLATHPAAKWTLLVLLLAAAVLALV